MKKRKSPKNGWLRKLWSVVWPILLSQGMKFAFDLAVAGMAIQPALEHLPWTILV